MHLRVRAIASLLGVLLLVPALSGPVRSESAGDIVAAKITTVYLAAGKLLEVPVRAWRLQYRSTSATGQVNVVSGTLLVPAGVYAFGRRPIAGYAMGTHGMGDQCAPSTAMEQGTEAELVLVGMMLLQGWAVAITDYEGLGTPGDHTYMAGISQGHAVLDSIRAAMRVPEAGLSTKAPVVIMGYSQGGASAAWAAQLQPSYAPELQLKGVAAGGVPADLQAVARHLDGTANVGLAAAVAIGFNAAYPELSLGSYLSPEGAVLVEDARDDCLAELGPKFAGRRLAELMTIDVLSRPDWAARLRENTLGASAPRVPMYLYHAKGDEVIPYSVGRALRDQYCAQGVTVRWKGLSANSHRLGAVEGAPKAIGWLAGRLLGWSEAGNC